MLVNRRVCEVESYKVHKVLKLKSCMKILFSGGYTLGPVTPLLAIAETIKKKYPEAKFLWVGTETGPEKVLIEASGIQFITIASGKMRRYISLWNLVDIFSFFKGLFQSLKIIWNYEPDICISAGGFVSVPVHLAGWIYGSATWVHQQDVQVGLANKIMAPFAKVITTALEANVKSFGKFWVNPSASLRARKTFWLGNPVRLDILQGNKERGYKLFNLKPGLPVVFATGGGTGSLKVNQLIVHAIQHLDGFCQVIHLSGKERPQELVERAVQHFDYYQMHQFFGEEMKDAYAVADLVISRGGFGTLTELSALGKPAILIPKPGHQEQNVAFLEKAGAAVMVDERTADGNYLAKTIKELILNSIKRKQLSMQLQKMLPVAHPEDVIVIVEKLMGR
jgi:UDP-N-acetylglucosamine--N-acetylmuramyl-(pentapeptide) pyrophosphoryl-undecaprenol N-acetylglucosamine transferase